MKKDGGRRSEAKRQRSDVRGQRSEVGEQGTEDRRQKTEDRGQRSEIRNQKSGVRSQESEPQTSNLKPQASNLEPLASEIDEVTACRFHRARTLNAEPRIQNNGFDIPIKSTHHLIEMIRNNELPDKIMINVHPQRWNDPGFKWYKELIGQNFKNVVKKWMIRLRN